MFDVAQRKGINEKIKTIAKSGDFVEWSEFATSNEIYGHGLKFQIASGVSGNFQHDAITNGEPVLSVLLDPVVECCTRENISLAQFFKNHVLLKEGNELKIIIKDSKGSLGTSPPLVLFQAKKPINQNQGVDQSQGNFNFKSPSDWMGAISAMTAAGASLATAFAALKPEQKEDRSISDIASLITALNSQGNNNELLFKFFEMQQTQRDQDNKRFEELLEQMQSTIQRDPYAEMERTEELLERIQSKAKPETPPQPPNINADNSFWDKGLDLVGKLLDSASSTSNGNGQAPASPVEQIPVAPTVTAEDFLDQFEDDQPEAEINLADELKQGDLKITQDIIHQAHPLSVCGDIGKLIAWAKDHGMVESIEEIVEADYDIEKSFQIYIQRRSTDPKYTEELLKTAQTFLPMLSNFNLKPEIQDEIINDISPASPDSLSDPGPEEIPTA